MKNYIIDNPTEIHYFQCPFTKSTNCIKSCVFYEDIIVDKEDKGLCTLSAYVSTNINKLQLTLDNQE